MEAIALMLTNVFEQLPNSHGFRKKRGSITFTFFAEIESWSRIEKVIKLDNLKCFSCIKHHLLLSFLRNYITWEKISSQCPTIEVLDHTDSKRVIGISQSMLFLRGKESRNSVYPKVIRVSRFHPCLRSNTFDFKTWSPSRFMPRPPKAYISECNMGSVN